MVKKEIQYIPAKIGRMLEDQDNCKQELANLQRGLELLAKDRSVDAATEGFIRSKLIDQITEKTDLLRQIQAEIYLARARVGGVR